MSRTVLLLLAVVVASTCAAAPEWTKQAIFPPVACSGCDFGRAVELSDDASLFIASGPSSSTPAVYVYRRDSEGKDYLLHQTITNEAVSGEQFGFSLSYNDGWLAVGARFAHPRGGDEYDGAVFMYQLGSDGLFAFKQELTIPDSQAAGGRLGGDGPSTVSVRGPWLLAGVPRATDTGCPGTMCGGFLAFQLESGTWTLRSQFYEGTQRDNARFGHSLDVAGPLENGEYIAVVGAFRSETKTGYFRRCRYQPDATTPTWSCNARTVFHGTRREDDRFGMGVAADGNQAIVARDGNLQRTGRAFWYDYDGSDYVLGTELDYTDNSSGRLFGNTIATRGGLTAIGAPRHGTYDRGIVHFYIAASGYTDPHHTLLYHWDDLQQYLGTDVDVEAGVVAAGGFARVPSGIAMVGAYFCEQGTAFDPYTDVCQPCPRNTYQPTDGSVQCIACPTGSTSNPGAAKCDFPSTQPRYGIFGDSLLTLGIVAGSFLALGIVAGAFVVTARRHRAATDSKYGKGMMVNVYYNDAGSSNGSMAKSEFSYGTSDAGRSVDSDRTTLDDAVSTATFASDQTGVSSFSVERARMSGISAMTLDPPTSPTRTSAITLDPPTTRPSRSRTAPNRGRRGRSNSSHRR